MAVKPNIGSARRWFLLVPLLCSACSMAFQHEFLQVPATPTAQVPLGYKVTYLPGTGNTGGSVPVDTKAYPQNTPAVIMPASGLTSATGAAVSWNTAPNGSGTSYSPGSTVTITASLTLYAQYLAVTGTTLSVLPAGAVTVTVPSGITDIGTVFQENTTIQSVTLPNTITALATDAFYGCSSLTTINIPASVTSLGIGPFDYCPSLTTITSASTQFPVINGALVDAATETLLQVPAKLVGAFAIPAGIVALAPDCFNGCANLTSISFPSSLATIGPNALTNLTSPIAVTLPSTVTSIGTAAFDLNTIVSITIPASVTTIGDSAFFNCTNLTSITMLGTSPPSLGGTSVLTGTPASLQIHVPNSTAVANYQGDPLWGAYSSQTVTP